MEIFGIHSKLSNKKKNQIFTTENVYTTSISHIFLSTYENSAEDLQLVFQNTYGCNQCPRVTSEYSVRQVSRALILFHKKEKKKSHTEIYYLTL